MQKETFVTIMAGGIGSRFWPISREKRPKQFLDLLGVGKSMLTITFERFAKKYKTENIFIVTSENYKELVLEQLPQIADSQVITEPSRKNTAPCILYTANKLQKLSPNANMIVTPADHFILEQDDFLATIEHAESFLNHNEGALLTLGIQPRKPHTGYGYIQYEETPRRVKKVKTFTEKPSLEFAKQFLESGDFLWNSGIFLWSTETIINSFKSDLPEVYELFSAIDYHTENEKKQIEKAYAQCPNISIDYGILEKSDHVFVLPSYFSWTDLGTWDALYDLQATEDEQNVVNSDNVLSRNSKQSIVHSENQNKLIVLQDVDEIIVVDTSEVLVICNKKSEQKIKEIVNSLHTNNKTEYL